MGLKINGILYKTPANEQLNNSLLNALKTLPDPELIPMDVANIKQGDLPLCMEREILYIDRSNPRHTTGYVGTKSVDSCVIAYFYNDIEHLTIHFGNKTDIDLEQVLAKLHDNKNLELMLLGAGFGHEISTLKLNQTLSLIYRATQKLGINITVTAQKLLERNKFTATDQRSFLFDVLMLNANIICQQYFEISLDYEFFPLNKVNEFKKTSPKKAKLDLHFLLLLPQIFRLYSKENKHVKAELARHMKKFKTKQTFYEAIDAMFCLEGFCALSRLFEELKGFPTQSLNNFAIDLRTKKLAVIARQITSDYEMASYVNLVNKFSNEPQSYRYVIDEMTNDLIPPRIAPEFIARCRDIQKSVVEGTISAEDFHQQLEIPFLWSYLDFFVQFVKSLSPNNTPVNRSSFFQPMMIKPSDYVQDIEDTTTLQVLQRITGKPFTAKKRNEPSDVVDAYCLCDSPNSAAAMQQSLLTLKIQTQLAVDDEGKSFISVPGINIWQRARRIENAEKKTPDRPHFY